jgi:hypothetical protein
MIGGPTGITVASVAKDFNPGAMRRVKVGEPREELGAIIKERGRRGQCVGKGGARGLFRPHVITIH